jgi:CDP-glucose 4,6-dehydratase
MKKTALVTGVDGFIGSHLVKFLAGKGWMVVGSYLAERSLALPSLPNLRLVQCDLRNGQRVTQMLSQHQPTHVFHLGAQSLPTLSWADPVNTFESNVMGSARNIRFGRCTRTESARFVWIYWRANTISTTGYRP